MITYVCDLRCADIKGDSTARAQPGYCCWSHSCIAAPVLMGKAACPAQCTPAGARATRAAANVIGHWVLMLKQGHHAVRQTVQLPCVPLTLPQKHAGGYCFHPP
jgi:hypothetical protein